MKRIQVSIAMLMLLASTAWAGQQVDETRDADADARIDVETISGSIRVTVGSPVSSSRTKNVKSFGHSM